MGGILTHPQRGNLFPDEKKKKKHIDCPRKEGEGIPVESEGGSRKPLSHYGERKRPKEKKKKSTAFFSVARGESNNT